MITLDITRLNNQSQIQSLYNTFFFALNSIFFTSVYIIQCLLFKYIKVKTKGQNEGEKLLVPKLRFKEFKNEWKKIKLKDISTDISYGMNSASTEFDGINKYIRITDIDEETSLYSNNPVSPLGNLDDKFLVKENDILFARTGASTGKSYLYSKVDGKLYFAGFLIRANIKKDYNSRFIFEQTKLPCRK